MVFDVTPDQIQGLESKELVEMLRRLLYAEAQLAGISLSAVSVPMQITIPDGGEDARIEWQGGNEHTNYLPSRYTLFQSKATNLGKSGWMSETWTKSSRIAKGKAKQSKKKNTVKKPKLNLALTATLKARGAYVGFTSAVLVGPKHDDCVQAIKDGILAAGGDPALIVVDIYDANKIANWASQHPSVAVWLSEEMSGLTLGGYQTVSAWGAKPDIATIPLSDDKAARYVLGGESTLEEDEADQPASNALTSIQAKERISDHLAHPKRAVRLFGPSGIGKTRFAYEFVRDASSTTKTVTNVSAIYCDYRTVGQQLLQVAETLARAGSPTLLIVDECPREPARQLLSVVAREGSQLRLVTIDLDHRPTIAQGCLNIAVGPGDEDLIESIIRNRLTGAGATEIDYIKGICGGFPRIAVLATDNYAQRSSTLGSIGDVVERILVGGGIVDSEHVRALETLALFERIGVDQDVSAEVDFVAERLAGLTGDRMYEALARASQHQLVGRQGRFFNAQPFPIATFLGLRRLDLLRFNTLVKFIDDAPETVLRNFLTRWRHFDMSRLAVEVAEHHLSKNGKFGSRAALESDFGAECFDSLVHVAPDAAADCLLRVLGLLSIEELKNWHSGRRGLVHALEKLVFRKQSFSTAARLLLNLAAGENEDWANNSKGIFIQLFQLHLSGTEATPGARYAVLDEGLASSDPRIISVCLDALSNTLIQHHFTRSGGSERIGSRPPLQDWAPNFWSDVFDFHRQGLRRLFDLRSKGDFRERCEQIITSNVRGLLVPALIDEVEVMLLQIAKETTGQLKVLHGVGDWLYFERPSAPVEFAQRVRGLYDQLIPTDPIEKALLYTKFWSSEIRDPDTVYSETDSDFEYSTRKARQVAADIAADPGLVRRAVCIMAAEELHNAFPFGQELGTRVADPIETFRTALSIYESLGAQKNLQLMRGLLSGIDSQDGKIANECVDLALKSTAFKGHAVNLFTSVSITSERLAEIVMKLRDGALATADCAFLSYGRALDSLSAKDLLPFMTELMTGRGPEGLWTALEVISMYQLGRPALDPVVEGLIKQLSTTPEILEATPQPTRDAHLLQSSVELIRKHGVLDDEYATSLGGQIVRLCQLKDYSVFQALDGAARAVANILIETKPLLFWQIVGRFFEIATPAERGLLEKLLGAARRPFDSLESEGGGVLSKIPDEHVVAWAKGDPGTRAGFLASSYPLLVQRDDGKYAWHPGIEVLARHFGRVKQFRDALARRFYPRSWSGSLVPHLQAFVNPLQAWRNHSDSELAIWAVETQNRLAREIKEERKRDAELN